MVKFVALRRQGGQTFNTSSFYAYHLQAALPVASTGPGVSCA